MKIRALVLTASLAGAVLAARPAPLPAEDEPAPADVLASLDWLAGHWKGTFGQNPFETIYTSPEGGLILSVSKELRAGHAAGFEFERFEARADGVWLTPYPNGKASVSFRLDDHDRDQRRAAFVNREHDFPTDLVYHRVAEDRLVIDVLGPDGKGPRLDLKRVE